MSNGKTIIGAILVFIAAMHAVECASNIRPVSVFPRAAAEYHRYAAVLAATEPYRLQRADDVKRSLGVMKYLYHRVIGSDLNNPSDPIRKNNYLVNSACAAYETKAGEIIRAYGLDSATFKNISRAVLMQPKLRQQVVLQTYYYRIAADLEDNIKPIVAQMPCSIPEKKNRFASAFNPLRYIFALSGLNLKQSPAKADNDLVMKFSRGIVEVERERVKQIDLLRHKLGVNSALPSDILCNPEMLPVMAAPVRKAYAAFPTLAERALRTCGMTLREFNYLLDTKMKTDQNFKRSVDAALNAIGGSRSKSI